MLNGLNRKAIALAATLQSMYLTKIQPKLTEERGDTNFISILIVLGIVLIVATVFIGFKDKIVTMVQEQVDKFQLK